MISNLLDIDFIQGDIHGRSCKNVLRMWRGCLTNADCPFEMFMQGIIAF